MNLTTRLRDLRRRWMPELVKWQLVALRARARLAVDRDRVLPDFLIVGAQKSGTTFLMSALGQSPNVVPAMLKETHYLDRHAGGTPARYRALFPTTASMAALRERLGTPAITGEATPYYLYHPYCAERAAALVPGAKIVAVLRDPVERAISHYWHSRAWGFEPLPIEEAFAAEEERLRPERERLAADPGYRGFSHAHHSYVDRGRYARQLQRWQARFPRERVLVLDARSLFRDPGAVLDRLSDFLGIPRFRYGGGAAQNTTSGTGQVGDELRARLAAQLERGNDELFELTGIRF